MKYLRKAKTRKAIKIWNTSAFLESNDIQFALIVKPKSLEFWPDLLNLSELWFFLNSDRWGVANSTLFMAIHASNHWVLHDIFTLCLKKVCLPTKNKGDRFFFLILQVVSCIFFNESTKICLPLFYCMAIAMYYNGIRRKSVTKRSTSISVVGF